MQRLQDASRLDLPPATVELGRALADAARARDQVKRLRARLEARGGPQEREEREARDVAEGMDAARDLGRTEGAEAMRTQAIDALTSEDLLDAAALVRRLPRPTPPAPQETPDG